ALPIYGRGVVATANYEARKFGIHSAMAAGEALRRCPHAVFVRPRHTLYREYSQAVWTAVREVVPTVERTGLDEGYLDIGEVAADFARARAVAAAASRRSAPSPHCPTPSSVGCSPASLARCCVPGRAGSTRARSRRPRRRSRSRPRRPSTATSRTSSS